jgi:hypothetical protein
MAAAGIQPVGDITHSTILAYIRERDHDKAYLADLFQYATWWIVNNTRTEENWIKIEDINPIEFIRYLRTDRKKKKSPADTAKMKAQRDKWDAELKAKHLGLIEDKIKK